MRARSGFHLEILDLLRWSHGWVPDFALVCLACINRHSLSNWKRMPLASASRQVKHEVATSPGTWAGISLTCQTLTTSTPSHDCTISCLTVHYNCHADLTSATVSRCSQCDSCSKAFALTMPLHCWSLGQTTILQHAKSQCHVDAPILRLDLLAAPASRIPVTWAVGGMMKKSAKNHRNARCSNCVKSVRGVAARRPRDPQCLTCDYASAFTYREQNVFSPGECNSKQAGTSTRLDYLRTDHSLSRRITAPCISPMGSNRVFASRLYTDLRVTYGTASAAGDFPGRPHVHRTTTEWMRVGCPNVLTAHIFTAKLGKQYGCIA